MASRILSALLRRRMRGSTRLTLAAAHLLPELKQFPVAFEGRQCFLDLRVPSSHGLLAGDFPERAERQLVSELVRPGQCAWDVGGHWGIYTILLSSLTATSGHVFTFEPSPVVLPALSLTVANLPNATLHRFGLGDEARQRDLIVPSDASMAYLAPEAPGASRSTGVPRFGVAVDRLDAVVDRGQATPPDFIKVDVEGGEALVFRGGRKVLDRSEAPVILFESHPAAAAVLGLGKDDETRALLGLSRPGYRLFAIGAGGSLEPLQQLPDAYMNVIAAPSGRLDRAW